MKANRVRQLLLAPAEWSCLRLARRRLRQAIACRQRLDQPDAPEALHDFRVALRRLRTLLRAYRGYLDKVLSKDPADQIADLARATNIQRDRQVQAAWLQERLTRRRGSKRLYAGLRLALDALNAPGSEPAAAALVQDRFDRLSRKLDRCLRQGRKAARKAARAGEAAADPASTFAFATAIILRRRADRLGRNFQFPTLLEDRPAFHQTRLDAKRLRYLLEPLRKQLPHGAATVNRLRRLQDDLGRLHDLWTLEAFVAAANEQAAARWAHSLPDRRAQRDSEPSPPDATPTLAACRALAAVIERIRKERLRLARSLSRRWLGPRADALLRSIHQIVLALETMVPDQHHLPAEAVPLADADSETPRPTDLHAPLSSTAVPDQPDRAVLTPTPSAPPPTVVG